MPVLSHHARRGIKVKDDIKALLNPESPGFKPGYKYVSRVCVDVDCLCCGS